MVEHPHVPILVTDRLGEEKVCGKNQLPLGSGWFDQTETVDKSYVSGSIRLRQWINPMSLVRQQRDPPSLVH